MDIWEAIRKRRAVRDYRPEPVTEPLLRRLIEAGSWAPSAMNGQPWRFIVITDNNLLERVSGKAKRWMLENDPLARENQRLHSELNDPEYQIFHHAPAVIVIAAPSHVRWSLEGCTLAAENIMLAATALGLGTCWIGLAEGWLNSAEGLTALNLDAGSHIVAAIAVGYPRIEPPQVARRVPSVIWIGPEEGKITEDGQPELPAVRALYGSLVHP